MTSMIVECALEESAEMSEEEKEGTGAHRGVRGEGDCAWRVSGESRVKGRLEVSQFGSSVTGTERWRSEG